MKALFRQTPEVPGIRKVITEKEERSGIAKLRCFFPHAKEVRKEQEKRQERRGERRGKEPPHQLITSACLDLKKKYDDEAVKN